MTLAGIMLIVVGMSLRLAARRTLRDCWSVQLRVPARMVTCGVYRYVRHPSYLGSLMIMAGLLCVSVALAVAYLGFLFFAARIIEEEKMLMLYPDYADYCRRTGALFPKVRLWRHG